MFELDKITRANIKQLQSYKVWRDDYLDKADVIYLDNCENNFGSPNGKGFERYPASNQIKLKEAIAKYKNVDISELVLGNGSDELIDLTIRAFCEPGTDSILVCEPTFGMFSIYAQLNNVSIINAPLTKDDFQFDVDLILSSIQASTKLIFLCTPNNPTGTSISLNQINKIANSFNGIVFVDEAYIDFSKNASAIELINQLKNVVVLQTFSKAWGLAALRLGVLYGPKDIISILNKIRPPFNISSNSQEQVIKALSNAERKDELVFEILKQKRILEMELQGLAYVEYVVESDANYFLIKVKDASQLVEYLLSYKVLISNRSSLINCKNYVRISVGNESENEKLIELLKNFK